MRPFERRFRQRRQEYQSYLPLIERVQADLEDHIEQLRTLSGWDIPTQRGISEWLEDRDSIFRALRVRLLAI